jgi:hypothetical protein
VFDRGDSLLERHRGYVRPIDFLGLPEAACGVHHAFNRRKSIAPPSGGRQGAELSDDQGSAMPAPAPARIEHADGCDTRHPVGSSKDGT